eukprot:797894-Pleurochrysis_carterae.AAC.1
MGERDRFGGTVVGDDVCSRGQVREQARERAGCVWVGVVVMVRAHVCLQSFVRFLRTSVRAAGARSACSLVRA